jgi:hypothetical protein
MEKDTFYWLFSSSAQSIAAFIAFVLTGYALVLNLMQTVQQNDPSIEDIHESLKGKYYNRLLIVGILSGLSVILNLLGIGLNDITFKGKFLFCIITMCCTVSSILFGIIFIILIIDPKKYRKTANRIIEELTDKSEQVDANLFFTEFVKLEKKIRDYLQKKDLYMSNSRDIKMKYSVSQMINSLYKNNQIGFYAYDKLLKINKYRNAIFHGHIDKVSQYMIDDIISVNNELDYYFNK